MRYAIAVLLSLIYATSTLAADCAPSPQTHSGTHYKPIAVAKVDIGSGLKVSGRVLSAGDCKPIANARVEHWQAGNDGEYLDRLYAFLHADASGAYDFNTEWPNIAPPHIHFKVSAPGFKPLTTMWVGGEPAKILQIDLVLEKK